MISYSVNSVASGFCSFCWRRTLGFRTAVLSRKLSGPIRKFQQKRKKCKKLPAKMGREAPHFADEAFFVTFCADLGKSWLV